jgi:predicted Zn-dependent protease
VAPAVAAACFLIGCGRGEPATRDESAFRAALARANDLASRHRIAEALAAIDDVLDDRAGSAAAPLSAAGIDLLERKGRLLITLGRPRDASIALEEVVRARPGEEPARRWLARALLDGGDSARAVSLIEGLRGATFRDALVDYAAALAAEGRHEEAATAGAAALAADPWNDLAYLELGRILVRAGRHEGGTFLERYRSGDAFRRAEQEALALESAGNEARALLVRARAERERGRLFEAMALLNRALAKDPRLGEAYLDLARLSIFLAKPGDAVKVLEQLGREPPVLAALAEAYEAAGDASKAASARAAARAADLRLAGEDGEDGETASPFLEVARAEARDRIRDLRLSEAVPALLPLARALLDAGKADRARALSLFLLRLAPADRGAVVSVVDAFDRPEDAFVRLWALAPRREPDLVQRFENEALKLGLEPPVLRALPGGAPVKAR